MIDHAPQPFLNNQTYARIKPEILQSLLDYGHFHVPTGGFLEAVLCNDLHGACSQADDDNLPELPNIVKFCYNELRGDCWGSPEKVKAWLLNVRCPRPGETYMDSGPHTDIMAGELRVTKVTAERSAV